MEKLRFLAFHRRPPNLDVVDHSGVIEGTESDVAGHEGFVFGRHDRFAHVVEIDFDGAIRGFAFEADSVPNASSPIHTFGRLLRNFRAGLVVHYENVVGVVIGGGGDVRVIEFRWRP